MKTNSFQTQKSCILHARMKNILTYSQSSMLELSHIGGQAEMRHGNRVFWAKT